VLARAAFPDKIDHSFPTNSRAILQSLECDPATRKGLAEEMHHLDRENCSIQLQPSESVVLDSRRCAHEATARWRSTPHTKKEERWVYDCE